MFDYLREHREDGIEKLYITWKTLNFRKNHPELFTEGDYVPLSITGKDITAAAYARRNEKLWLLVIFPFGLVKHEMDSQENGNDQFIVLPEDAPEHWINLFTNEKFDLPNQIAIQQVFQDFPVALLVGMRKATTN